MAGILREEGFEVVAKGEADVAIVNTCGFVKEAKEESIGEVLSLAALKGKGRIGKLVVAGCLPRRYREELPRLLPEADLFVGPADIPSLPAMLRELLETGVRRAEAGEGAIPDRAYLSRALPGGAVSAFLKILEGCDNRCSYCAIPLIRGPLKSRDGDSLLEETRRLARAGAREICLVGQDITAWGADRGERGGLPALVRRICRVRGVKWVRLLYLYPSSVDDGILDLLASEPKVVPYLDIPVQHADPGILSRMGRRYGPEELLSLVARARERVPGVFLRTSLIVGFPGETAAAFDRLLRFVHEAGFDFLGVFPYSREEGTAAWSFTPRVGEKVKMERMRLVQEAQADILAARNRKLVGSRVEVLVEERPSRGPAVGRHRGQAPEVDGSVLLSGFRGEPGEVVEAVVTEAREWDLAARADGGAVPGAGGRAARGRRP
jgi:ribosomal protein S12 methylthiotransferase